MNAIFYLTPTQDLNTRIQRDKEKFQQAIRDGKEFSHVQEILQRIRQLEWELNSFPGVQKNQIIATPVID